MQAIFEIYGWDVSRFEQLNQGLINSTSCVYTREGKEFILQTINHQIFKDPVAIDQNIQLIGSYLQKHAPHNINLKLFTGYKI